MRRGLRTDHDGYQSLRRAVVQEPVDMPWRTGSVQRLVGPEWLHGDLPPRLCGRTTKLTRLAPVPRRRTVCADWLWISLPGPETLDWTPAIHRSGCRPPAD